MNKSIAKLIAVIIVNSSFIVPFVGCVINIR